jgi:transposase InsO family protein
MATRPPTTGAARHVDSSLRQGLPIHQFPLHHPPADLGVTASIGSVADSYDNAMAESLNATFKTELIHRRTWRTRDQVEYATVEWVGWYDHRRLHHRDR